MNLIAGPLCIQVGRWLFGLSLGRLSMFFAWKNDTTMTTYAKITQDFWDKKAV